MNTVMTRAASVLLALLVVVGLAVPAAAAPVQHAPTSATAAAPVQPGTAPADLWGKMCAASVLTPVGTIGCLKKAADGESPNPADQAAKELSNSVLDDFAKATAGFTADVMKKGLTWWLTTESVSIEDSGVMEPQNPKDPSSSISLHGIMLSIGTMIAILMAMMAGIRTMIQRKGQPIAQAVQGLLINCLVIAVGVGVIDSLLVGSDKLTEAILKVGFEDDAPEKMVAMLLPQMGNPAGLLFMAAIVLLVGGVQVVLLFLRQAAVPIQALLLPIAGAGQMGEGGARQWLPKLINVIMSVICYKPCAALIMTVGFVEIDNSDKIIDWIRGVVTLVLSVIALKGLMAIFAPIGVAVGNASAGGGLAGGLMGMAGSIGGGAMGGSGGEGGSGGGGTSAADQAAHMDRSGPASGGGSSAGAEEGSSAVQQANTSVPAQQGAGAAAEGAAAGEGAAAAGSSGAAAGSSAAGASGAGAAAGGPAAIAIVAAEAAKGAADKSGQTMGKGE